MEGNSQESITGIDKAATSLLSKEICSSWSKCCIYKVPDHILKGKEECYRPFATSIGLVFYNDPKLEPMQEYKHLLSKAFREHPDNANQSYEPYTEYVRQCEDDIQECYQEQISLPSDVFIKMIVLDATFFIYLMISYYKSHGRPSNGPFPVIRKLCISMQNWERDMFLEENQLPFFVLEGIYGIAFNDGYANCSFTDLALEFMGNITCDITTTTRDGIKSIIDGKRITDASNIKHLVDLYKNVYSLPYYQLAEKKGKYHKFDSAMKLSAAGVKFKTIQSDNLLEITFDKNSRVLRIPKLYLVDGTESALRSILFFEQCHCAPRKRYFTDYVIFLDGLIDNVDDVQVLQKREILNNDLGSDEDARDLFNSITKYTFYHPSDFLFSKVSKDLKDYASSRKNRWKAILWSRYFNHPWAIISVIYTVILLILTLLQTITGFFQIHN